MAPDFVTLVHFELSLGVEPIDAVTGNRIRHRLVIEHESANGRVRGRLPRRGTGLHAVLRPVGGNAARDQATAFRVYDRDRRIVPRRLAGLPDGGGPSVFRPRLFPGAAADVAATATGLRVTVLRRVERSGRALSTVPYRWVRAEATIGGRSVAVAHGDDRGELLLLLPPLLPVGSELPPEHEVRLAIFGGPEAPASTDWLADLPLEVVAASNDAVARGEQLPAGYAPLALKEIPVDATLLEGMDLAALGASPAHDVTLPVGQIISKRFVL
jgi:hypothetical protein